MSHLLCLIRTAKISIWLSGVAITVILSIVAYAGLIIYTRFRNLAKLVYILWPECAGCQISSILKSPATNRYLHCDPITSGLVSTKDQLLPLFVIDILGHIPGSVRYIRFLFLENRSLWFLKTFALQVFPASLLLECSQGHFPLCREVNCICPLSINQK